MRALIIYAHPNTKGHCPFILEQVIKNLKSKKIKYELLDLYRMNYDPVMHESEIYTAGRYKISVQNKKIQEKINKTDLLIFIYPIWWASMPAILKGFFDRVLTSHYAFEYRGSRPVGLLKGKKAIVFMTSGGPKIFYWLTGNSPWQMIKFYILRFCGVSSRVYHFGSCRKLDEKKREEIKNTVEKALRMA